MNRKMVFYMVGRIVRLEAFLLFLPLAVALYYQESCAKSFIVTIVGSLMLGTLMMLLFRSDNRLIYAKEGFAIVALSWLLLSLIGALPFYISREIPSLVNAFFETVSGFTTTGASILTDVEHMSRGLLFWRSFTHWIGGMGVLVLILAIIPNNNSDRSIHILRAEIPGPTVGKLVPRLKDTAKILYLIYLALTLLEITFLLFGGMPLFDSVVHAFGTAGTGGFGIKSTSIAEYSPYLQWVIGIFMLIFGVNFNLYFLILIGRLRSVIRSSELWVYLSITVVSTIAVMLNIAPLCHSFTENLRISFFQVSSILTTTGFSTTDFNRWPGFSKTILLLLMMIGGCAGSTAGGLKVSRIVILVKRIRKQFHHLLHPRSVSSLKMEGKPIDDATADSVAVYFSLYILLTVILTLLLSLEPFDLETNLSATLACFNNIGPGLGAVGPAASYFAYSDISKILLSAAMLLGRLEIFPLLLLFSPSTWSKK